MKSSTLILFLLIWMTNSLLGQICISNYLYSTSSETVIFSNNSLSSNAKYYWNFGDGTSSKLKNPTHRYPESGIYLATLYVHDSLGNCSDFHDEWITIAKISSDPCTPLITDSIFTYNGADYLKVIESSLNCNSYSKDVDAAGAHNWSLVYWFPLWKTPANFITKIKYFTTDTLGAHFKRAAYKTSPYKYNRAKNYNSCSANFEFSVISQDSIGQRILFKPMNLNASSYRWTFLGFGNSQYFTSDTVSHFFPYTDTIEIGNITWAVGLKIVEANGCADSLYQHINTIKNSTKNTVVGIHENEVSFSDCKVYPNPVTDILNISSVKTIAHSFNFEIRDLLGRILLTGDHMTQINVSALESGCYYISITDNQQKRFTLNFIKE